MLVIRRTIFFVTSALLCRAEVTGQGLQSPHCELAFICGEIKKFYEYKVVEGEVARICFCFISNVLFSIVIVYQRTALNAILLVLYILFLKLEQPWF